MAGRQPSLLPRRRSVGAWGKDATVQMLQPCAAMQSRREGKGSQGLCYALFLLILGLLSAAIRPSSAMVSVGPGR